MCVFWVYLSVFLCLILAQIDVCRVRPCVIGRAPASLGVVGMLGEQFCMAVWRGGRVGVCVLGVS